jgi:hypothetical protein
MSVKIMIYNRFQKDSLSQMRFLSILPLPNGKSDTHHYQQLDLQELQLLLTKMCAFRSEGASVMVGQREMV